MSDLRNKVQTFVESGADSTAQYDPEDIKQNRIIALLSYLSWLVLVPIFGAKESKFARFHANQGLVLAIGGTLVMFVLGLLKGMKLIGWIFSIASALVALLCFVLAIIGIINALNGKAKELPLIGGIKLLK